ncbi:hypothetical protein SAMN05216571_103176 [Onishia taeanensis]|uniref:Uncharacterized protein n=1 Tax=Onishia taeanensis TaxID=284577 RepID=A0A1G7QAP0_9GAMM|nr:hypothetical protein SAMN05216571_103176 [Halomonas taeanensis]
MITRLILIICRRNGDNGKLGAGACHEGPAEAAVGQIGGYLRLVERVIPVHNQRRNRTGSAR